MLRNLGLYPGLLVSLLTAGICVVGAHPAREVSRDDLPGFIQPFSMRFYRIDTQIITWLAGHPDYDAVEVFVEKHEGKPWLIRSIITHHDGSQVDHLNDSEEASQRSKIGGRRVVYSPTEYSESLENGIPVARLRFKSYRGEDIAWEFRGIGPVSADRSGFINPGNHAIDESLPVMWRNASTIGGKNNALTIDGRPVPLKAGPAPGTCRAMFTSGFLIGLIRTAHVDLSLVGRPAALRPGEKWVYRDQYGKPVEYVIAGVDGDRLTVRKTTDLEEIITARYTGGRIEILSISSTGWVQGQKHGSGRGFTLEMIPGGKFSIGIDQHENLVTGRVETVGKSAENQTRYRLVPVDPEWARLRMPTSTVINTGDTVKIENGVAR